MPTKTAAKSSKRTTAKRTTSKAASKSAAPKRSTTKAAIKKPVAAKAAPPIKVVPPAPAAQESAEINKREFVERVVAHSGMKKGEARRAVDAVLGALNKAISEGKGVAAAPLGKMKLVRKKQTPNGELAVLRVKLKDAEKAAQKAAAAAAIAKPQK
ncbi:MAG: HU family DNA-binding protein [Pseudomonadota bacterium]